MNRKPNLKPIVVLLLAVSHAISGRSLIASPAEQQKLTSANTGFAFQLLKAVAKDEPRKNIFISPYSVSTVLQMVANGAEGKTKQELQQVLGTRGMAAPALNEANSSLNRALTASCSNVVLNLANAVWYRQAFTVQPAFVACNRNYFQATVAGLDFDDPRLVDTINSWASNMTHGRIPSIVSGPINPLTRLYLANAVYFKGGWFTPFELKDTKERVFHLNGGKRKTLPMMTRTDDFSYRRGTGYQAVRLPYKDWNLAMYVFLPDPGSSPEKLLAIMNGDNWQKITLPGFAGRKGTLALPRLKLEYGVDLKTPLRSLGLKHLFEDADLSGIGPGLSVSEAKQKAFVEVNEEGTEAAAVTWGVAASGPELNPPKPFEMIVDRPFLFVIHNLDQDGGSSILFMGMVFDPLPSS